MKIVHFAKFYPPEYGGIESVTEALAEDHAAAGLDVEVVCFTRDSAQVEKLDRLVLRRIKVQKEIASQPLAVSYLGACTAAARNADVVHAHLPNMLATLAVLRLPLHIQVVLHWHADIVNKGMIGSLVRPIERAMLRRADTIVATSQNYAYASSALKDFGTRVKVIPIGIADVIKAPRFEFSTPPYVLFVGRLVPYKGLPVLLDAITMVQSDVKFRIVGTGPLLTDLQTHARRLGISDRVEFLGRVEENQLRSLMQSAAIFCLPSINRLEAFGVVLLEAMRAQRAIISTNIFGSGVPWVNSTGINVPVNDPIALAKAIDQLLADPEETARLGKLARCRFEEFFTRDRMSSRLLHLYEHVLEE